ncbi:MAG: hypothetical protein ACK5KP_02720 [Paludibacteraceae bacterium]
MDKKIQQLRTFFRVSNAAFDCVIAMSKALGNTGVVITPMHKLHQLALEEIEKGKPDLAMIDSLLEQMELLAKENSEPKPNFPKGGV